MTQPYTDADVELVAQTFITEAKKNPADTSHYLWGGVSRLLTGPNEFDIARAVLSALAAAGRLTPSGGTSRVVRAALGSDDGPRWFQRTVTEWPDGSTLDGPWLPVPTEEDTDR